MAINVHSHIWAGDDVDARVDHYRHPEVTRTVLFGDDDKVAEAQARHADFVIGFGTVRYPVPTTPETVRRFADRGFRGVKIIGLRRPYDDAELFPMYEEICRRKMPILFHTGHLGFHPADGPQDPPESVLFMHPSRLDTLARRFPDLVMIGAHLGNPYYQAACSLMCKFPNIYFDMSGGTVKLCSLDQFRLLFTRGGGGGFLRSDAAELHLEVLNKLVFGTDNPAPGMMLEFYHNFIARLHLPAETAHRILSANAAAILGV